MRPFLVTQLYALQDDPRVIQRIVQKGTSGDGDVDTILLREKTCLNVAVRDRYVVHSMMEIRYDSDNFDGKNRMCWANFEEMDDRVLCVLSTSTQVRVWDSASFLGGGEGSVIHLPCEATSIFAMDVGILIQRRYAPDDYDDHEDDEMVYLSKSVTTSPITSLFSCRHPLKTILPVSNSSILEQVVFVGVANGSLLAVTFHIELLRHSVWVLKSAGCRENFEAESHSWERYSGTPVVVEHSFLSEDGNFYDGFIGEVTSRKEALADALGVGTRQMGNALLANPPILNFGITPLYPDLSMTPLFLASFKYAHVSNNVFLADNFLCVSTESELHIWKILHNDVVPVAEIPCICAIPIQCVASIQSQSKTHILVVNSTIQLFYGGQYISDVQFGSNAHVRALHDPVANRLTVELIDGSRFRAELRLTLTPLVERVLSILDTAVGGDLCLHIRLDTLREKQNSANQTLDDPDWQSLCVIIRQLFGIRTEQPHPTECSAWDLLLNSSYHTNYEEEFSLFEHKTLNHRASVCGGYTSSMRAAACVTLSRSTPQVRRQIFDALHLLYEEFKLSMLTKPYCHAVRGLLLSCLNEVMHDFYGHYQRDERRFDVDWCIPSGKIERLTSFSSPPCVMSAIAKCMHGGSSESSWINSSLVESSCSRIELMRRVFNILTSKLPDAGSNYTYLGGAVLKVLLECGIKDSRVVQDDFPFSVSLLLLELLSRCRDQPIPDDSSSVTGATWNLIGREDVFRPCLVDGFADERLHAAMDSIEVDPDGLVAIESTHSLRFPADNRLKEVARLLRSSKPSFLKVLRAIELSDHEFERLKQERLLILCRRVLALPLGRGMFTLGTLKPVSAEQLPIPELCLSGRLPPANTLLALDLSHAPADMTLWPDFHNGVAAGLRLPSFKEKASFKITRSWIIYNKVAFAGGETSEIDSRRSHAHGGFLMALGFRGHLTALSMTDVYEYLTEGSITTSVGVLLGMAANKRGTCDPTVSKMLCLHIPSLLPLSFSSIDVSAPAHSAAVTGIGILYQGSSHRLMTEFLLKEMGRRPLDDSSTIDREAYALSCGLALGMITLAKGGSGDIAGLSDLEIEQRLIRFIVGGLEDSASHRRQDVVDRRMTASSATAGDTDRCARVHEGGTINNDVSAPGALLALGLMYMKSSNKVVASMLAIPDTHFLLEYSRPDTLALRVLARSLILWNEVQPTAAWVEGQIPRVVRKARQKLLYTAMKATEATRVGARDSTVEKWGPARSNRSTSPHNSLHRDRCCLDNPTADRSNQDFEGVRSFDRQTVRQMHAYIVAGSCFSMGLRFAGTADQKSASVITKILLEFTSFRDCADPVAAALRPEHPVIETCLSLCSVSLALIMAGTGDLDTLRLFKTIRWKADEVTRYGTHMAISAAIGLLFLGGGTCTIGDSPEDIVALVAAFFPRYPLDPTDNKYHLQALRHLYVLAVKERQIQAYDVDTDASVSMVVEARFKDSKVQPIQLTTPNLMINFGSVVKSLVVQSEEYFHRSLLVSDCIAHGVHFYVKKRPGGNQGGIRSSCHDFAYGSEQEQGYLLLMEFLGQHNGCSWPCYCKKKSKQFCSDELIGCISNSVPAPFLPVLGILRLAPRDDGLCLSWDAVLLHSFCRLSEGGSVMSHLVDPSTVALILEKVKNLLSGTTGSSFDSVGDMHGVVANRYS